MTSPSALKRSDFKAQYHDRTSKSLAQVERDLRRLEQLIKQYKSKGLNSIESNERDDLVEEYGLEHSEAFNLQFKKDN